jgi:formate dehydrogenase major subunit
MHMALDPNVHIQESKAATCGVRPGRRPRGQSLAAFMAEIRDHARKGSRRVEPAEVRET